MTSRGIRFSILLFLAVLLRSAPAAAVILPQDFTYDVVASTTAFTLPTALAFLPDGRLLVAEKEGRLWVVVNGVKSPVPVWDGHTEILSNGDRGLLGIAVDPDYATNRFLYLLYTADPDSDDVDDDNDAFGRLTRYTMSAVDTNVVDPASRTILMGADWRHGAPSGSSSHTVGGLRWGSDGSLLVSIGDGGHYERGDAGGLDPDLFGPAKTNPYEDIGAFRAQYLGSLAGKILRLDPATGNGYPSNPFYDGDATSNRSKVFAYGCRNTFRFSVAPGTGSADPADGDPGIVFAGDVGWNTFEEFNVVDQPGRNFGWPCTEGLQVQAVYDTLAPPFHCGCDSIGAIPWNPSPITWPRAAWHHVYSNLSSPPGLIGNSVTCGVTYTGDRYPALYRDKLFMADFGRGWIKLFVLDASWNVTGVVDFADQAEGPVDLIADPATGDLYYIAILRSEVRRIRYTADPSNHAPVAVAAANPSAGPAPLQAGLFGGASYDEDMDSLTAFWSFGDGMGAVGFNVPHLYAAPGTFEAVLTVSDPWGGVDRDTAVVVVTADGTFPTTGLLDDFERENGPVGPSWSGQPGAFALSESTLVSTADGWVVWGDSWGNPSFGPTQEAFVTVTNSAATADGIDLLLKVQGGNPQNGHLRIHYDGVQREFWFEGSSPGSWHLFGDPVPMGLSPGDVFGARAYESGVLELYVNGALVKSVDTPDWPLQRNGGSIGLGLSGAAGVRLDDFGGGTTVLDPNTPPTATILQPQPGLFYAAGDTIVLSGAGADAEDPPDSLAFRWDVDLHHNNHIHPSIFASTDPFTFFLGENHDDGTGVYYTVRLRVTDTGAKSDTTSVDIYPDVDLTLDPPWSDPVAPGTLQPALYGVTLRNVGAMPSPLVRWQIAIDGMNIVAAGDTLLAAGDSAAIQVLVPPLVAAGWHTLSAAVDILNQVVESSEANNAQSVPLLVVEGGGTSGAPAPASLFRVGVPWPNPARGRVTLRVETRGPAEVSATVFDVAGRRVRSLAPVPSAGGALDVAWDGRTADGGEAAAGVYQILVRAGREAAVRRVVRVAP